MGPLAAAEGGAGLQVPDLFLPGRPAEAPLRPEDLLSVGGGMEKDRTETLP